MYGFRYTIVIHDRKKLQDAKSLFNFLHYNVMMPKFTCSIKKVSLDFSVNLIVKILVSFILFINYSMKQFVQSSIYGTLHMLLYVEDL